MSRTHHERMHSLTLVVLKLLHPQKKSLMEATSGHLLIPRNSSVFWRLCLHLMAGAILACLE